MYVQANHTDWDLYLKGICYAYNTSICTESVQFSPFYLMFGRMPIHPIDTVILPNVIPEVEGLKDSIVKLQKAREVARQNVLEKQQQIKERYDQSANPVSFEPGDLVWIYFPQIQVGGCRKFFHNYSGPYILLEKTKSTTFRVAHAHNNQPLKNEVHVNRMKRFHHRSIVPGRIQVQPDLDEVPEETNEKIPSTAKHTATHRLKRLQQPKRLPKLILKQKMGLVEYVYKDGESKNKIQNQPPLPKLIIKQKEGIVKVASHGTDSK